MAEDYNHRVAGHLTYSTTFKYRFTNMRLATYIIGCGAVLLVLFPGASVHTAETTAQKPNILILLADDLGWNDVSYHGGPINTPNIDRLANMGIELDRFYAQPTCSPTRASLMTGKSAVKLGMSRPITKNDKGGLPLEEKILPQYFENLGYQRFIVGKWHLGMDSVAYLPTSRGFEHFYGSLTGGIGYWDKVHGGGYDWQRNGNTVREAGYVTHLVRDEVLRLIESRDRNRPLLMYIAFQAPHLPNEAPKTTVKQYEHLGRNRAAFAGMVDELDQAIGAILSSFDSSGLLDNTIVLFMSDNGGLVPPSEDPNQHTPPQKLSLMLNSVFGRPIPSFPFSGLEFIATSMLDGGSDNAPLSGGKGQTTEGGVRVPAVIWWPGRLEDGLHHHPVTVADVLPTLLEAAGGRVPSGLDGRSQLASLEGGAGEMPDYVIADLMGDFAFYRWPHKLVDSEPAMLFNVIDDPSEKNNLAQQMPLKLAELQAALANWGAPQSSPLPLYDMLFDPDNFGGIEDREPWADTVNPSAYNPHAYE